MKYLKTAGLLLCGVMSAQLNATGAMAAPPDYYPQDYGKIVDASKKEPSLLIYGNIAEENWRPIISAFNQDYPWIKVNFLDLASDEVFQRYYAEQSTGSSTVDIVLTGSSAAWLDFISKGNVVKYDSPEISKIPANTVPAPGLYTISYDPQIIAWNKLLLPEAQWPKSVADIAALAKADPSAFDKKIGVMEPMGTSTMQSIIAHLIKHTGEAKEMDIFNVLGPLSVVARSAGPTYEKILTGEFTVGFNLSAIPLFPQLSDPNTANIIGWAYPTDGTVATMRNFAIATTTKNPDSARLFVDFLLSKKGQEAVSTGGLMSYRSDIDIPPGPVQIAYSAMEKSVGKDNIIPTSMDPTMLRPPAELIAKVRTAFKLPN